MKIANSKKQIHYHKAQRRSIGILLIIMLAIIGYGEYIKYTHHKKEYNSQEHNKILSALSKAKKQIKKAKKEKYSTKYNLSQFDPNSVSKEKLIEMGISNKLAKTWTNFTNKGGKIYQAKDLLKIYGMNEYLYEKLEPYVNIPQPKRAYNKKEYTSTKKYSSNSTKYQSNNTYSPSYDSINNNYVKDTIYDQQFNDNRNTKSRGVNNDYVINMNTCDSIELQVVKGIGKVLSSRIIRYREGLGGYHNINQLLEVYGVKPALLSTIMHRISFEGELRKIKINTISKDSLVKHPYFDWSTANAITLYREKRGPYKKDTDFNKLPMLESYWLEEVLPYFDYTIE